MKKRVLISGAASGIGRACATRFAEEGCEVCINDVQAEKLDQVFNSLKRGNHLMLSGDCADPKTISKGRTLITEEWGGLDVLVNSAGRYSRSSTVDTTLEEWKKIFDLFIHSSFLLTNMGASLMDSNGRIIHITSIHGDRAEAGSSSYAMAKAAINQYCRSLAVELAPRNILVNAIAPGFVSTPMSYVDEENELESKLFIDNYVKGHHLPLKRAADPAEIAGVALFLAGEDSTYITGQVINVDGGLTITF